MNLYALLAMIGVRRDGWRAFSTLLAFSFITSVGVAAWLVATAAMASFGESEAALAERADFRVVAPGRGVSETTYARVAHLSGVDARPIIAGEVSAAGLDAHLLGVDLLRPLPGTSGATQGLPGVFMRRGLTIDPTLVLNGSGAIVSARFAERHRLKVGDHLRVGYFYREVTVVVASILPAGFAGFDSDTIIVDIGTAQNVLQRAGYLDRIDVYVWGDRDRALGRIDSMLLTGEWIDSGGEQSALPSFEATLRQLALWLTLLTILPAVTFAANAVGASVTQRSREIATVRALGARRRAVVLALAGEGATYGLLGGVTGGLAGVAAAQEIVTHAARMAAVSFDAKAPIAFGIAVLASIVLGVLVTIPPALRATAGALADGFAYGSSECRSARIWTPEPVEQNLLLRLAILGLMRSPRRFALAGLAFAFAALNVVTDSTAIESFRSALSTWAAQALPGDLIVQARNSSPDSNDVLPAGVLERIQGAIGVASAVPERDFTVSLPGRGGVALRAVGDVTEAPHSAPSPDPHGAAGAWISPALATRLHLRLGDPIIVATPRGRARLRVGAIPDDFGAPQGSITVSFGWAKKWFADDRPSKIVVRMQPQANADLVRHAVSRAVGDRTVDIVLTRDLRESTLALFDRSSSLVRVAALLGAAFAVVGVSALMFSFVRERRAQFAILRCIGATGAFVGSLVITEATLIVGSSVLAGIALGGLASYCLLEAAGTAAFGRGLPMALPFVPLVATLLTLCAVGVASAWPAARIAGRLAPIGTRP